ncbi:MAG: hypothetical protein ACRDJJ_08340 [Actinomycetota bacterium]
MIRGGDGNDQLYGGGGDDDLYGEAGDDSIDGDLNATGPPAGGDLGNGGPNDTASPGDQCIRVERAVECETTSRARKVRSLPR